MIMAVMARETWTDERLDDLNRKVGDGFARIDADLRELRSDLNREVGGLRSEMNARFDAMNRNFIAGVIAIIAAIIGSNATLVAITLL
jgi:hypothetical protein